MTDNQLYPNQNTLFSPCRTWRYFLRRPWQQQIDEGFADADLFDETGNSHRPPIAFCLLNPSTADERKDDPTVARCRQFAVAWGYGDVIVLNAFAYRATDPRDMKAHPEPIGADNDKTLTNTAQWITQQGGMVVCGWGNHGAHLERSAHLKQMLAPFDPRGFPLTKAGEPGHPLYLKSSTIPVKLRAD